MEDSTARKICFGDNGASTKEFLRTFATILAIGLAWWDISNEIGTFEKNLIARMDALESNLTDRMDAVDCNLTDPRR